MLVVYDAPYVLYAHSEIAVVAGLSKDQVQQAVQGKAPDNLSEQEAMARPYAAKSAKASPKGLREGANGLATLARLRMIAPKMTNGLV